MESKGFTILEILVVVAIIAIVAGIALANFSTYNVRGKNSSIRSSMNQMALQAAVYFEQNGSYAGFFGSPEMMKINQPIKNIITVLPGNPGTTYNARTPLNDAYCFCSIMMGTPTTYACVDSVGHNSVSLNSCTIRCTPGSGPTNGACQP